MESLFTSRFRLHRDSYDLQSHIHSYWVYPEAVTSACSISKNTILLSVRMASKSYPPTDRIAEGFNKKIEL